MIEQYKQYVAGRLAEVSPLLQRYALGDFSESIDIPGEEDEFTELFVAMNLMVDDLRESAQRDADRTRRIAGRVSEMIDSIMKVARGDYSVQVEFTEGDDDLNALARGLNMMVDDIRTAVGATERERAYVSGIVASMADALIVVDRDATIGTVNAAARKLLGYGEDELVGQPVAMVAKETSLLAEDTRVELADKGYIRDIETAYVAKDGEAIPVSLSAAMMRHPDGQLAGIVFVARDLREMRQLIQIDRERVAELEKAYGELEAAQEASLNIMEDLERRGRELSILTARLEAEIVERKRAQEQLQRYAVELRRRNREIRDFAYVVSHDFRAPLVNLKGFCAELRYALQVIEEAMPAVQPHLDESQRKAVAIALQEDVPEALSFIESSVARMDRYISAVLKLSRLGRRELDLQPLDVEPIVRGVLEGLAHQIAEHQAEVIVGALPPVVADRTSMEQIMGNLLSNAVKYLEPHRPCKIEILGERRDGEVLFQIRDNGRGIADEDMDKIFMPFRRVGRQDTPGDGMGLPHVQTMVRRHGGRIWCDSELGVGTVFTFAISDDLTEADND
jgi:PAS domain S-box-containing protein